MNRVKLLDAKSRLSALINQVEQGREFIITRRGRPVARLIPVAAAADQAREAIAEASALRARIAARGESFTWDELATYREGRR